jgi:hypothetical protein
MVMQEQARRLSEPLRWGRREKTVIGVVLALVAVAVVALIVFAASSGSPARADCIDVTFPSTLGAAQVHACGGTARRVCDSGSYRGVEDHMRAACSAAGFPYRPPAPASPGH